MYASVTRLVHKKAYKPPNNVEEVVKNIVKNTLGKDFDENNYLDLNLNDRVLRFQVSEHKNKRKLLNLIFFKVLNESIIKFKHNISNTTLNDIKSVQDVVSYFKTEVDDSSPLESLANRTDLPKNLNINLEYVRFDPKNKDDTLFNGADAFPDRKTYTTSLWYSRKYKPIDKEKEYFSK